MSETLLWPPRQQTRLGPSLRRRRRRWAPASAKRAVDVCYPHLVLIHSFGFACCAASSLIIWHPVAAHSTICLRLLTDEALHWRYRDVLYIKDLKDNNTSLLMVAATVLHTLYESRSYLVSAAILPTQIQGLMMCLDRQQTLRHMAVIIIMKSESVRNEGDWLSLKFISSHKFALLQQV